MKQPHFALKLTYALAALIVVAVAADAAPTSVPGQQQAVVQTGLGGPEVLKLETIPVLRPGPGEVLVRVYAAAINPADWLWLQRPDSEHATVRRVAGSDLAGVIVAVGPNTTGRALGMPVFAMTDRGNNALNGAFSKYAVVRAQSTAPKPPNLSYAEAAGLGVVGVTAVRILDQAQVRAGQRVLITGVSGGVGSVTAQLAVARGATVLGTASPRHAAYLHSIGVSQVIDYSRDNTAATAGTVDAVIDTVGGNEAIETLPAIKPGGHFVSVANAAVTPEQCLATHIECSGSPGSSWLAPVTVLEQVGKLASQGKLRINIDRTYPLERAAEALQYLHQGHTEGKVVLTVGSDEVSR